ncbi:hypothetical protein ACHBHM_02115 [Streptococcus sp. A18]|uniref:hypothetical protein n=1 Tax=Streptococcus sp. A18 TaxID=3373125 RepID=UPI00374DF298
MENITAFAQAVGRDIKDLQTKLTDSSGVNLVNTGWVVLSDSAKIKRFGDVVTLDLNVPIEINVVLGTIPSEIFSVGDSTLSLAVAGPGRVARYIKIDPTGSIITANVGVTALRTQVTVMT